jgi:hypothetical protein|tara:strand:- start:4288 stop:4533 length:246 start_codon:yes stop_codon:yes gene_type:complete
MKNKKDKCYTRIFNKLDHISERLTDIRAQISDFKIKVEMGAEIPEEEEICIDELESTAVLLELALGESLSMIAETEPQGDA